MILIPKEEEEYFCLSDRKWLIFFLSSIFSLVTSIIIVLVARIFHSLCCPNSASDLENADRFSLTVSEKLIPGLSITLFTSTLGKVLVVVNFFCSMLSLGIFFQESSTSHSAEYCQIWTDSLPQKIDLVLNVYFLLFFCLRVSTDTQLSMLLTVCFFQFARSTNKLYFLLELYTIVDVFSIPPMFVSIYLDRTWLGFRFLRALHLMSLPLILQHMSFTLSTKNPLMALSNVTAVLLTFAGFILLLIKM